ncbi:hypothetical protein AQPE_4302 [Aquipluma nitroreducens]|uniref:Winged helix-turn-helix domain-containing protein n=1 Tax=Aquipluma nitroreducens TaxID=2010828 RepID=A0A5K7SEU8_9BACT|nr:winged helix-turn-helix domain-containing protein [Aquipluma nitroreducens]BBE20111.1 hypothetical protein AQPE_4302 [Aquipluma nitroreducens]
MTTDKIGRNARILWVILNNKKGMSLSALLKTSELTESDFSMAIGWLAREYKIAFYKIDEEQMVTLLY